MRNNLNQGSVIQLENLIRFFNDAGEPYYLSPGDNVLLLESNKIDAIVFTCGEILYCHVEDLFERAVAK